MKKIIFTGDLMALIPENKSAFNGGGFDFSPVFSQISPVLKKADYVVGNLETPLGGECLGYTDEPTHFNTPKEFAEAAVNAGFSCFSLANNHCLDRGIQGLENTITTLDRLNVDHTGTYSSKVSAISPLIKNFGKTKVSFLSYTYGTNSKWRNNKLNPEDLYRVDLIREQDDFKNIRINKKFERIKYFIKRNIPQKILDKIHPIIIEDCGRENEKLENSGYYIDRIKEKITKAKENSDFIIMLLHCGGQYNSTVGKYTRETCRTLIKLGCDLVIVNHPHCILPYELYDDKPILYALGNFCFTPNFGFYYKGVFADYSLLLNLYLDEESGKYTKSIEICKVINEKNGHSVVYPLYDLINKTEGIKKMKLIEDNYSVLERFFQNKTYKREIAKEYFF